MRKNNWRLSIYTGLYLASACYVLAVIGYVLFPGDLTQGELLMASLLICLILVAAPGALALAQVAERAEVAPPGERNDPAADEDAG